MTVTKSRTFKLETRAYVHIQTLPAPYGSWSLSANHLFQGTGGITSVRDDNLRDWKGKIARHESATTDMDVTGVVLDPGIDGYFRIAEWTTTGGRRVRRRSETKGNWGGAAAGIPTADMSTTNVSNLALTDFLSKCYSAQRTFSGGVFLGELRETINWLRHPGSAIKKALSDHLKRVKRMKAPPNKRLPVASRRRMASNAIAGSWLEAQFAIKPLEQDIEDALVAVYELVNKVVPTENIRSRKFKETEFIQNGFIDSSAAGFGVLRTYRGTRKSVSAYMYGQVCLANGLAGAPRRLGLSFQDVVPVLWEVTPWSFVFDYFSNIGDILEALTFNSASVMWANTGTKSMAESLLTRSSWTKLPPSGSLYYEDEKVVLPQGHKVVSFALHRRQYTGNFIPTFSVEIPGLKSRKWLNLAALADQMSSTQKSVNRRFRL